MLVYVGVTPHEHFKLEKSNIKSNWNISVTQAILGGTVKVKTMKGETEVKIKPGTQDGTQVVLKGHGMPNLPPN